MRGGGSPELSHENTIFKQVDPQEGNHVFILAYTFFCDLD
jgi:hypothetical protein